MEFPNIGENCSFKGCSQLDFLPFWCGSCGKKYCLDHRYPNSHECFRWSENEKNVQLCETCSSMILNPEGRSVEQTLEEHLKSNCVLHLLSSIPIEKQKCFITECKNKSEGGVMVYVVCDGCGEAFCLKHRHPPAHQCESLNVASDEKAKRRVKAEELISKYKKKSASSILKSDNISSSSKNVTTNKPKKKNKKIEGDSTIPVNARVYLSVDFPLDSKVSNKPLFFNKEWTIGKVLDKVATVGKITNNNNKLPLDDPNRLILVNKETGNSFEMDKKLGEVVESGDDIYLEKLGSIN
ncbi:uncharacterized protein OCT59_006162 [Rhizophagus irregularis]|uniref:AN1-type domain-containing protein n=1 Tax=Rhizophagus irregularis TaxID=588596 RepID=A0A915ZU99_9GLOM|nr:hypothetical protein OCT59_006162 [Rhizophagus irregularis]GBC38473.1 AN1-type zinc finger protein 1 isoform X1 [Rhizophagus irregularis DAOM 181602=DAOM 197198]CAB4377286.1 unnamed protein product [Rhizophagus irregularis]CAB5101373.1 unnamed protein product [Rhizophagus irregularis]CAB5383421.1 unnamed protein product [Rhizophagus irregularis]